MALSRRVRRGTVAAAALAMVLVPGSAARAAGSPTGLPTDPAPPGSGSGPSVPTASDVAEAQQAAQAAAEEVATITAEVKAAEARLRALQRGVSEAVAAQQQAEQQLADAESAVQRATSDLARAQRARAAADSSLSATAAQMYMQGGDLQDLTTLVLAPPNVMSDLAVVLDQSASDARTTLDAASSAAVAAAAQERLVTWVRDTRDAAAANAQAARAKAEKEATKAGAEAATLGAEQERLTARLAQLQQGAEDLAAQREAAARLGAGLLGRLYAGGPGPAAAQEIARSAMGSHGWTDPAEFPCLVALWNAESGWSWSATNPSSGAYGIPQALPGWKMASAGNDWLTNPATQIEWGMGYIRSVYGSPCAAYGKFLSRSPHWY
jgi:hypothetical protein